MMTNSFGNAPYVDKTTSPPIGGAGKMPRHYNSTQSRRRRHFGPFFSNLHKCRPVKLISLYPRSSKLDRHGCSIKFGDSMTNRSPDIRVAHFVMEDERRRHTVNTYGRTPFDILPESTAASSTLLPTSDREAMTLVFFNGTF